MDLQRIFKSGGCFDCPPVMVCYATKICQGENLCSAMTFSTNLFVDIIWIHCLSLWISRWMSCFSTSQRVQKSLADGRSVTVSRYRDMSPVPIYYGHFTSFQIISVSVTLTIYLTFFWDPHSSYSSYFLALVHRSSALFIVRLPSPPRLLDNKEINLQSVHWWRHIGLI